jgi:hypothetical protein
MLETPSKFFEESLDPEAKVEIHLKLLEKFMKRLFHSNQ